MKQYRRDYKLSSIALLGCHSTSEGFLLLQLNLIRCFWLQLCMKIPSLTHILLMYLCRNLFGQKTWFRQRKFHHDYKFHLVPGLNSDLVRLRQVHHSIQMVIMLIQSLIQVVFEIIQSLKEVWHFEKRILVPFHPSLRQS